jgi:hypothetical protein
MSLVHEIINHIDDSSINELSAKANTSPSNIENALYTLAPGFLSAIKAKLTSDNGNQSVVELFKEFMTSNNSIEEYGHNIISTLFQGNENVKEAITNRVAEKSNIQPDGVSAILPESASLVFGGLLSVLQREGFSQLLDSNYNNITNVVGDALNGNFQDAIQAANKFIGSVFGNESHLDNNSFFSGQLLSFLDADKDGSVMDDIVKMFAK